MRFYFDIETYSRAGYPQFTDKVIAIAFKGLDTKLKLLAEWKTSEKEILEGFFDHVKGRLEEGIRTELIGYNVLRFDLPFLIIRAFHHKLDSLENLQGIIHETYTKDLIQCLLPYNNFTFAGLNSLNVASRLGIPIQYAGRDVKEFYENREYDKIEEHIGSDVLFVERLDQVLREKTFSNEILKL